MQNFYIRFTYTNDDECIWKLEHDPNNHPWGCSYEKTSGPDRELCVAHQAMNRRIVDHLRTEMGNSGSAVLRKFEMQRFADT